MVSTKAQVTIQINWIFVMIAGGVILLFFLSLVRSQITSQNTKISITTLNDLDALFTATFIATESHHLTPVPDSDILFDESDFYIDSAKKEIGNRIIFSPRTIHGDLLFSWSKETTFPYRISNLLYVTSPEIFYLFVYNDDDYDLRVNLESSLASDVLVVGQDIRKGFNYDFVAMSDLAQLKFNSNNYQIKLIYLNTDPHLTNSQLKKEPDESVSAIKIVTSDLKSGKVSFYYKDDYSFKEELGGTDLSFISFDFLLGAVFSQDALIYKNNVDKWLMRFNYISRLNYNRINYIKESYEDRSDFCSPRYLPILEYMDDFLANFKTTYDPVAFNAIKGYSSRMKEFNNYLITGSCETIY